MFLLVVLLHHAYGQQCAHPGISPPEVCWPPSAQFNSVVDIPGRRQWGDRDGYCGAASIQMIALTHGAWISQDLVRKANGNNEVLHTNAETTITNLKLLVDAWDTASHPRVQWRDFLTWMKKKLASAHPVVTFIYCKGDSHGPHSGGYYDHIEPFFGLYSNRSLDQPWSPDDVLVHHSDYDQNNYYRTFGSIQDTEAMDGNCAVAPSGYGRNEMYPCIMADNPNYGYSIVGVLDPPGTAKPAHLYVDAWQEPDLVERQHPIEMKGILKVKDLIVGTNYTIYRWDDKNECPGCRGGHYTPSIPSDGSYPSSHYSSVHAFTATAAEYSYEDPTTILSSGATYYRCV